MAIFNPGPLAGQISGRVGGTIFSHNKGGPYVRNGAIPVQPSTTYKADATNRMATVSRLWGGLTDAQRDAWRTWAGQNKVTDRLGRQIVLGGNAAFNMLNVRLLASGDSTIDVPPIAAAPDPVTLSSDTWDIGAGNCQVATAPSPLGANLRAWVWGAVLDSPGARFVKNQWRLLQVTAKNVATPITTDTLLAARFGTLAVGQHAFIRIQAFDSTTGLISGPADVDGVLSSTP